VVIAAIFVDGYAFIGGTGGLPGAFLHNGASARGHALGQSMTAYADDVNALYLNPSGLALGHHLEVSLYNHTPFENVGGVNSLGTQYNYFGARMVIPRICFAGVSVVRYSIGGLDIMDADFSLKGEGYELSQTMAALHAAKRFFLFPMRYTAVGVSVKYLMRDSSLPGISASSGIGIDVGLTQQLINGLYLGVSAANVLAPALTYYTEESFPVIIRTGLAYKHDVSSLPVTARRFLNNLRFYASVNTAVHDADYYENGMVIIPRTSLGLENTIPIKKNIADVTLRAGLTDIGVLANGGGFSLTAVYGVGVRLFDGISLDAASDTSALGPLNRIMISVSYDTDIFGKTLKDLRRQGDKHLSYGQYADSRRAYEGVLQLNPDSRSGYQGLARVAKRRRQAAKARTSAKQDLRRELKENRFESATSVLRRHRIKPYYQELTTEFEQAFLSHLRTLKANGKRQRFTKTVIDVLLILPKGKARSRLIKKIDRFGWQNYRRSPRLDLSLRQGGNSQHPSTRQRSQPTAAHAYWLSFQTREVDPRKRTMKDTYKPADTKGKPTRSVVL